ncbi:MAG: nicotinamide riboside transporter PnuC [Firmicutes bacterium]|nr:nicotinamide riboside transporter PnuC [Bacillota bacterium]MCL2229373.1 nicotinamide riboside transporter PnuC [Bacillota bacterium]
MQKIRDYFSSWTLFEKILTVVSIVILITVSIVFRSWWVETLVAVVSIAYYILYAKGKVESNILGIIAMGLYAWVAWTYAYYGEVIQAFAIEIPMLVFALVFWSRNKNNRKCERFGRVIKLQKVKLPEVAILLLVTTALGVGIYFGLRTLGTAFLIVSTISICVSIVANYLSVRRSVLNWYGWLANDLVQMILWSYMVYTQGLGTLPILISIVVMHIINIYGFVNWLRLAKRQNVCYNNSDE